MIQLREIVMIRGAIRRLSLFVAIGLAAVLAAGGCGSSAPATGTSAKPLTHLTVGVLPIVDTVSLFVAIKDGYFRQQGLSVTPKVLTAGTDAIPDMVAGSIDITSGNYVSFIVATAHGVVKIRILAEASTCNGDSLNVLALPSAKISDPAGLAGKSVAVNGTGNVQTLTINALLEADHVSPATVKYVVVPFPDMVAALKAGRVDAMSAAQPFITGAEKAGAASVLAQCQGPTAGLALGGYFATNAWVQKNPKTALAFQGAIEAAQAKAASDRALVDQILPTYIKITPKLAASMGLPGYPVAENGAQLQRLADLMHSGGLLARPFSMSQMLFHPAGS
jgi:NitT/TauT family transport system substrate-binding protein